MEKIGMLKVADKVTEHSGSQIALCALAMARMQGGDSKKYVVFGHSLMCVLLREGNIMLREEA